MVCYWVSVCKQSDEMCRPFMQETTKSLGIHCEELYHRKGVGVPSDNPFQHRLCGKSPNDAATVQNEQLGCKKHSKHLYLSLLRQDSQMRRALPLAHTHRCRRRTCRRSRGCSHAHGNALLDIGACNCRSAHMWVSV